MRESWQRVIYRPIRGINAEAEDITSGEADIQDSYNFLFERGVAVCRPEAVPESEHQFPAAGGFIPTSISSTQKFEFGKAFQIDPDSGVNSRVASVFITDDGELHKTYPTTSEITGAGTTLGNKEYHNADIVNKTVLVGNNSGGLLQWDYIAGNTYTVISDAKYRYVTGHGTGRALAGFDITSGSLDGAKVAWSVAGDETDWTGEGSGTSILSDIADFITGIRLIRNVWVILRSTGFTLGYPTGIGTAAFRFENHTRVGPGCPWPSTVDSYNNLIYYVGEDNVYVFDLNEPIPIGTMVRDELFSAMRDGVKFRGIIEPHSYSFYDLKPRLRYHLVPFTPITDLGATQTQHTERVPHFTYDVQEQTWAKHTYATKSLFSCALYARRNRFTDMPQSYMILIPDEPDPDPLIWSPETLSEASDDVEAKLIGRPIIIEDNPSYDYAVQDALVVWSLVEDRIERRSKDPIPIKLEIRCNQTYNRTQVESQAAILDLTDKNQYDWHRTWFNFRIVGQFFQPILTVPHGTRIKVERIELHYTEEARAKTGKV